LWHHNFCEVVIFIGPNTFRITIASEREPIRLPACILNRQLADSMAYMFQLFWWQAWLF